MLHLEIKFQILKIYSSQANFASALQECESKVSRVINSRQMLTQEEAEKWKNLLKCQSFLLKPVTINNKEHV